MSLYERLFSILFAIGLSVILNPTCRADTIKIAVVQPMTGPNTQYGDQIQAGALTAIEMINAQGGVKGKKLEPILIDDACEPKQVIAATNQVIRAGAKYVIAHACSGVVIPALTIYEQEGILAISPAASSPFITDSMKPILFFRTVGRDDQQGPFAAEYIVHHLKAKQVAVLHDKQTYGAGLATQVKNSLLKNNINIPFFEGLSVGDNDYSAIITKLKQANVDLIYFGGYHPELGLLLRQSREQGLHVQYMSPEGTSNPDLFAIAGPAVEGLLVTFPVDSTQLPANQKIVKAFYEAKRQVEGLFQLSTYAAIQLIAQGIEAVGDNPLKVADYLHRHSFDTAIGQVAFNEQGDLKNFKFAVYKWDKNGNKVKVN